MLINTLMRIKRLDGSNMTTPGGFDKAGEELLVGKLLVNALLSNAQLPSPVKNRCFELAYAINGTKDMIEIADEDIAIIKNAIQPYEPFIVGRLFDVLEGDC